MKPLKYASFALIFLFLFLGCSTATAEEVYTLNVTFISLNESGTEMLVQFFDNGKIVEESVSIAEDCRFLDLTERKEINFATFVERYMTCMIEIDFIIVHGDKENDDNYLVIECRGTRIHAS